MIVESPLTRPEDMERLAERLSEITQVDRYSDKDHDESWTLVHAFGDLEESFRELTDNKFPKLFREDLSDEEVYELLLEIGEELRHIQYHINDPRFYEYIVERSDAAPSRETSPS
jgi:hypothetical protein